MKTIYDRAEREAKQSDPGDLNTDDSSKLKVLIADDETTIRSTLAAAVRDWGYRTIEAATLAETFAFVDTEQPHALLLDVKLPDGSGIAALDELRKRAPELVIIVVTGYGAHEDAFAAGVRHAYGYVTKPIDQPQLQSMLAEALKDRTVDARKDVAGLNDERRKRATGELKRGRPQRQTSAPLGQLILKAMKLLGLSYKDIVAASEHLAKQNNNADMRIGKSTLGNIISGSIRQPGTAKLDSLRIILNLSRADIDASIGLQPERRLTEQLEIARARTHEIPIDAVTRHRRIKVPILREDAKLEETQFFEGALRRWTEIEVEYLSSFYPPYLAYVVVGEDDTNASPIAPPGSRLLVNRLLNRVYPAENSSFHERELFCVMTPHGLTCSYAELGSGAQIVLIPHPASGNLREVFNRDEVSIIGQVVGVLYPA
ncbi:MAG TPA: response regulator [Pyrinomonadaceae bacterium]